MKPTGVTSTSFRIWLATFIPGLAAAVTAFAQNSGGSKSAVLGVGGLLTSLLATLGKLFHDHGVSVASIYQAGSDIAKDLPELQHNAAIAASLVEQEIPGVHQAITDLNNRLVTQEQKVVTAVPDRAAVEEVVRSVLAGIAPAPAPTPTPPVA